MSIWATWLDFSSDQETKTRLEEQGIVFGVIGGETENPPYVYEASHIIPDKNTERGGDFQVASVPNHVKTGRLDLDETNENLEKHRVDFLRIDTGEKLPDGSINWATIMLDYDQVKELRDTLTTWLDAPIRW